MKLYLVGTTYLLCRIGLCSLASNQGEGVLLRMNSMVERKGFGSLR